MVDETTDRSTSQQLIVYIKYLNKDDEGAFNVVTEYFDLVPLTDGGAEYITVWP